MRLKARWRASSDAQFLGYSFWVAKGAVVKRRVADKPMATFKQRIRQLTRRSGGRSVQDVVQRLRPWPVALLAGVPMGVYAALRRGNFLSPLFMPLSLLGVSLPSFLIGILMILVFAVWLGWFPSVGRGDVVNVEGWSTGLLTAQGWHHIVLPALTLAIFQLTLIMRLVRAEMLEVLRTDYIKFARTRGLSDRSIHFGHALSNTLVPVMTITGLQLGGLIAFAIITETVFQWPGMGLLFIQAVNFADTPVMAAYLCPILLIFVLINLVVDLLYFVVDPRLRVAHRGY